MGGACMAELVTEGKAITVDLHPFRLGRFAEGDPIVGVLRQDSVRQLKLGLWP